MASIEERALSVLRAVPVVLAAAVLSACGTAGLTSEAADTSEGKALFKQKCGSCHTLREAGTRGSVGNPSGGPNLDDAFRGPKREGFDQGAIRETVRHQIDYPTPPMPANLLEGEEADAVAVYVAMVAADPKAKVTVAAGEDTTDGQALFEANCGSCHVLEDAGTSGTAGPNLDQSKPEFQEAFEQIKNGGGGMPPFRDQLSEQEIANVAAFVTSG